MAKEIRIPHDQIADAQTITRVQEEAFQRAGLSMHRHEVDRIDDDFGRKERILTVQTPKRFFCVPDLPWLRRIDGPAQMVGKETEDRGIADSIPQSE